MGKAGKADKLLTGNVGKAGGETGVVGFHALGSEGIGAWEALTDPPPSGPGGPADAPPVGFCDSIITPPSGLDCI